MPVAAMDEAIRPTKAVAAIGTGFLSLQRKEKRGGTVPIAAVRLARGALRSSGLVGQHCHTLFQVAIGSRRSGVSRPLQRRLGRSIHDLILAISQRRHH